MSAIAPPGTRDARPQPDESCLAEGARSGHHALVSEAVEHVDAGTRRYLDELRSLQAGHALASADARAVAYSKRTSRSSVFVPDVAIAAAQMVIESVLPGKRREFLVALFELDAVVGDRPLVVVPIEPDVMLDGLSAGSKVTTYGKLAPGHAIAVAFGDLLLFPLGPARKPGPRSPRCDWA